MSYGQLYLFFKCPSVVSRFCGLPANYTFFACSIANFAKKKACLSVQESGQKRRKTELIEQQLMETDSKESQMRRMYLSKNGGREIN